MTRQLTHAQLAMRAGLDRSTISRIMNGSRQPTLDTAVRLIQVLDGAEVSEALTRLTRLADPTDRFEDAVRGDPRLTDAQRGELLRHYRGMRSGE
ncbi:MAG: helix-turn-helix domain-containing protein [Chloroflexota bacterium]